MTISLFPITEATRSADLAAHPVAGALAPSPAPDPAVAPPARWDAAPAARTDGTRMDRRRATATMSAMAVGR